MVFSCNIKMVFEKQETLGYPVPSEGPGSWQGVRVMDKLVADCVPLRKCLLTPASSGSQRVSTNSVFQDPNSAGTNGMECMVGELETGDPMAKILLETRSLGSVNAIFVLWTMRRSQFRIRVIREL